MGRLQAIQRMNQAALRRDRNRLGAVARAEFANRIVDVKPCRGRGPVDHAADVGIGASQRSPREAFEFTFAQVYSVVFLRFRLGTDRVDKIHEPMTHHTQQIAELPQNRGYV